MNHTIKNRIDQVNNGQVPEGYKTTEFGVFPIDWEIKPIGSLLKIKHGRSQHGVEDENGLYPILATGGVIGRTNCYLCNMPCVLIGRKGTINKPQYMDTPFWSVDTLFYSEIQKQNCAKYLYYIFLQINWAKYDESTGVPSLSARGIEGIKVRCTASIEEQERIAEILMTWDEAIELQEQYIEKLKLRKKALLSKMFPTKGKSVPELRFPEFTDAWELRKLGKIGTFTSNGVDKLSRTDELNVNLLNYMDVYNRRSISSKTCRDLMQVTAKPTQIKNNNVLAGDVYFTPTSETAEDIGHVLVIEENLPNTVYSYHLMRFRPNPNVFYLTYPNYGFDTDFLHQQMSIKAKGVQRFVVSKSDFESLEVVYPSFEEQEKVATLLGTIDNLITIHQQKLEKLKTQRKALMQLLLTGIVRVSI